MDIWTPLNDFSNHSYCPKTPSMVHQQKKTSPRQIVPTSKMMFNHFNMINLEDYHKFYLLTDVLLLADMFENFKDVCLQHYSFDPAHNITYPGFSWQAGLNPKTAGRGEVNLTPPVIFQKLYLLNRG